MVLGFTNFNLLQMPEFVGFDNYINLFLNDDIFLVAAKNTLVFAVPFINDSAAYSFVFAVGSGIGAGIAFVLAAALISKGSAALEKNKNIPEVFKGTPAMLIYVGLLSLAFAGFAGTSLFA